MSETMKVEGKILEISSVQTFASGFQKRTIVVETSAEKYPQQIPVEFVQDNIQKLDGLQVGDGVSVAFNLRGREFQGRYFVNLAGWNVRSTDESRRGASNSPAEAESPQEAGSESGGGGEGVDSGEIPF